MPYSLSIACQSRILPKAIFFVLLYSITAMLAPTSMAQSPAKIPDAAALANAKILVDEVYADLLDVKSDEDRAATARVLIMRADETENSLAAKYVMYDTARSLAVEAGDTYAAMDAINGLIESFEDDSGGFLNIASDSLQSLSRKSRNDKQYAAVSQAGLALAEKLIAAERQEDAMGLLTRLKSPSLRSRRPELISAYKELLNELKAVNEEKSRIAGDLETIKNNPNDPALNLSVGKYLTLYRGNWETGLTMLTKSSDERFVNAAEADLAGASNTHSQISLGDQWWALALEHSDMEARSLKERAKHWYRQALPSASGIERGILTKRLSPPGLLTWGGVILKPGIQTIIELDGDIKRAKPGPIAKVAEWAFDNKPADVANTVTLHFEGYLYSSKTVEVILMMQSRTCSYSVEVNGQPVILGHGNSASPVQLIKGYNLTRGTITVKVSDIENVDKLPSADLGLTDLEGAVIPISAEHWFHDATR